MSYLTKQIKNSTAYQCVEHCATTRKSFLNFIKINFKSIKPKLNLIKIKEDKYRVNTFKDESRLLMPNNYSTALLEKPTYLIVDGSILETNFELSFFIKLKELVSTELEQDDRELYEKAHGKKEGEFYAIFPFSRKAGMIIGNTEEEKRKISWGLFLMTDPIGQDYIPILKKRINME